MQRSIHADLGRLGFWDSVTSVSVGIDAMGQQSTCRVEGSRKAMQRPGWKFVFGTLVLGVSYLALTPQPPPDVTTGWDKLNHTLAFLALAFAGCDAFPGSMRRLAALVIGLMAFGAAIEVAQHFVPGRSSEWMDWVADCVGIAAGCVAALATAAAWRRPRSP
jgi:VanZ family protein